jgi:hypothetical protein
LKETIARHSPEPEDLAFVDEFNKLILEVSHAQVLDSSSFALHSLTLSFLSSFVHFIDPGNFKPLRTQATQARMHDASKVQSLDVAIPMHLRGVQPRTEGEEKELECFNSIFHVKYSLLFFI